MIRFSEDARRVMMLYRWPGNVRQLKNVVEQIALFNAGEEVSGSVIKEYLPSRDTGSTSIVEARQTPSYEAEREMLWQMVLAMKNEIQELRGMMSNGQDAGYKHKSIVDEPNPFEVKSRSLVSYHDEGFVKYDEPTTLEDTEKETILRALERNGGVRKKAAQELHISERTLYRKIKEYGLE